MGYIDKVSVNGTEYDVLDSGTRSILNNALTMKTVGELNHAEKSAAVSIGDIVIYGRSTQGDTPTPSAPVAINTAGNGGTLGVVSNGKNFLISSGITSEHTKNTVVLTPLGNGQFNISGTNSATSAAIFYFNTENGATTSATGNDRKKILPNGSYVVSGCPDGFIVQIRGTNSEDASNQGSIIAQGSSATGFNFTVDDTYAYNNIRFGMNGSASFSNVTFTPVINRVDDTTTEGYSGTIYPVTVPSTGLPGIAVSSGGNYTDSTGQQWICDTIDLGKGIYTQRVGVHTFTSAEISEETKSTNTSADIYLTQIIGQSSSGIDRNARIDGTSRVKCVSNIGTVSSSLSTVNSQYIDVNGTYARFSFVYGAYNTTTLDQFKAMMNGVSGGVTVLYPLIPVETPLTDTQLSQLRAISTIENDTWLYNDGGSGMKVRFFADLSALLTE